jgi:hypothetical protein
VHRNVKDVIGDFLNNKSKCRFQSANKNLVALDLKYIINIKIVDKNEGNYLTNKILLQPKFLKLIKLNINNNKKITNLNHLKKTDRN